MFNRPFSGYVGRSNVASPDWVSKLMPVFLIIQCLESESIYIRYTISVLVKL